MFEYFEEICGIPHGSSDTKAISDYCVAFAKDHGLQYIQDESNNVIIFKNGTPGYENSAPVILQGHLDMVCEKEADYEIDFKKDGLRLQLEDGIVTAEGTTLGGDDGIAVAYALAILSADDIAHPPLEVVFTIDEEIGMLGAAALDTSVLKGRIMLNMDSEEEGCLLTSCAGGVGVTAQLPLEREKKTGVKAVLGVTGLLGGHSGVEIDKGRANACMLLGRSLYQLQKNFEFHLISVNGGLKDNAIPREAVAELLFSDTSQMQQVLEEVAQLETVYAKEYSLTDPSVKLVCTAQTQQTTECVMTTEAAARTITALVNLPDGIQRMSHDIEGLVQTSLNLGILKTKETELICSFAVRSSVETEKIELVDRITSLTEMLGGFVCKNGDYPAWEYRKASPLRELMAEVYREQYGKEPEIQAIHAGLECGLFSGKLPGLDCISYGPDMKDIHTPQEAMYVDSVQRTWMLTLEVLKRLK